jgi:hypothetical protein
MENKKVKRKVIRKKKEELENIENRNVMMNMNMNINMNISKKKRKIIKKKKEEIENESQNVEDEYLISNQITHFNPYPEITSDNFDEEIYKKKEFRDFEIKESEIYDDSACTPGEFSLSPFQSFVKNYISIDTPYNGLLIMYSTGVGKTCAAISIAEGFKKQLKQLGKRILILTTLRKNFENELFNFAKEDRKKSSDEVVQCTGQEYELPKEKRFLTMAAKKKEVEKMIRSYYQILGYQKFANYIMKMTNGWDGSENKITPQILNFIHEEFDNRVIIIDEVHNIKTDKKEDWNKAIQPILISIVKHARNTKIILMSATPMYNSPDEIIFILNLLLANDGREQVNKNDLFLPDGNLKPQAIALLSRLLKGYVSYARGEKPLTFPFRMYPKDAVVPEMKYYMNGKMIEPEKRLQFTKIVLCEMDSVQNQTYVKFLKDKMKNMGVENEEKELIESHTNNSNIDEDNSNEEEVNHFIEENNTNESNENESNTNENDRGKRKKEKEKGKKKKKEMDYGNNENEPKTKSSVLNHLTYISTIVYPKINHLISNSNDNHNDSNSEEEEENKKGGYRRKKKKDNTQSSENVENQSIEYELSDVGSYGKEGINNDVDNGNGGYYKVSKVVDGLRTIQYKYQKHAVLGKGRERAPFADEKYLHEYSSKFSKALDEIKNSQGTSFVYSTYVDDGILPFALMLEQNGKIPSST